MATTDVAFDDASDTNEIRYRLHPLDVGFDLRAQDIPAVIDASDEPIRVSYAARNGERRVIEGPQVDVLQRLRAQGYRFSVSSD